MTPRMDRATPSSPPLDWRNLSLSSPLPWDDDVPEDATALNPPGPDMASPVLPGGIAAGSFGAARLVEPPEERAEGEENWPRLCCIAGPCQHYLDIAQVSQVVGGVEHRTIYRYCRLLQESSGTMELRELTLRFCSGYKPPLWSIDGWLQRVRMAQLQVIAARRFRGTVPLAIKVLSLLARSAKMPVGPGKELEGREETNAY